jgi:hypothetical protein
MEKGKASEIGEILLIDPSPAMIDLAFTNLKEAFPSSLVKTVVAGIEEVSRRINSTYDIALSSLAYHHMPLEKKMIHVKELKSHMDHFVLFEVNADHDAPQLHSPDLALSIYQTYGRVIDFVFTHDAPVDVACSCVDYFLMTEAVSLLTQPRGVRTEYHMLRSQWRDLFAEGLGSDFACLCDATCYADEYVELFILHYGR